ncbi:MAG: helix-turn-helix domain-containing protein [Sphaerochaetaceae bacterium]|nr:helix-turn-helix domain-containing protein [Sphaerochaetaceae bacterium]
MKKTHANIERVIEKNDQWTKHLNDRMIGRAPFMRAKIRQGGYGIYTPPFLVERTKNKGFDVYVLTLSGKGFFMMEDGTQFTVEKGDLFISSSMGQGHLERCADDSNWEHIWFSVFPDNPILHPGTDDWKVVHLDHLYRLKNYYLDLFYEDDYIDSDTDTIFDHLESLFLISLIRALGHDKDNSEEKYRYVLSEVWERFTSKMNDNWTVDKIASEAGLSRSHLNRICLKLYNKAPGEILKEKRMQLARTMVIASTMSIDMISDLVGYQNVSNFSAAYKDFYTISPREDRKASYYYTEVLD